MTAIDDRRLDDGDTVAPEPAKTTAEIVKETFHHRRGRDRGAGSKTLRSGRSTIRASDDDLADLKPADRRDPMARARDGRRRHAGRAARDDPEARRLLARPARLAEGRSEDQLLSELRHRDRRARHPLHPCEVEASRCAAADRHPRLARIGHRAAEDHRSADRSDRLRRTVRKMRSTSSSRRCRATASPESRRRPAGDPNGSPAPGSR